MSHQDRAITDLSTRLAGLSAQMAVLNSKLNGMAAASAESALHARVTTCEPVEPLRMGGMYFMGEVARRLREAQEMLSEIGFGQLEVVQRNGQKGEHCITIDGQVFISKAAAETAVIDPARFSVKVHHSSQGKSRLAGFGISKPELTLPQDIADAIREILRGELKPGGMLHRS
ncbi:hypothetical protein [Pseudomonas kurunegalensis]|uniref:hypothetical protein n=1 Tax=Pseudomonas kurunegalensis TaxID=485880 RepID=UPI0028945181|nr:hypothetical protein [Pseudomonas kurunegalensis]MDT3750479.1 hypothetical protein [Pseudomonas kurunegalensis]